MTDTRPDPRLDGDPASCRATAAALRSAARRLHESTPDRPDLHEIASSCEEFAAQLDRYGDDLAKAGRDHAHAAGDVQRHAALALVARARRRLRLSCDQVVTRWELPPC